MTKQELENLLSDYSKTRDLINQLEKQSKEARTAIVEAMGEDTLLNTGGYFAVLTECTRQSLDKKRLIADQGQDFVNEYSKTTSYKKLEVKSA
jgi:predicted phage-related endonuclease